MLIGAAASGKSTAAPKIAAEHQNAVILSTDKMRAELYGAEHIQGNWSDIEALLYKRIKNAIKADKNIILDSTHFKKEYRAKIIKNFAKYLEFSAYYFNYPFALIYSRNKRRADSISRNNNCVILGGYFWRGGSLTGRGRAYKHNDFIHHQNYL